MLYDRNRLAKVAFIGAFAAAATTVFIATIQDSPPRRIATEDDLRSMFSLNATEEQALDFKSMFSSAKPEEPELHP